MGFCAFLFGSKVCFLGGLVYACLSPSERREAIEIEKTTLQIYEARTHSPSHSRALICRGADERNDAMFIHT